MWTLELRGMWCLNECFHVSNSSAKHGEHIMTLGENTTAFKTIEGSQRCITCRSERGVTKHSFQCRKLCELETWMKIIRTFEIFEMKQ